MRISVVHWCPAFTDFYQITAIYGRKIIYDHKNKYLDSFTAVNPFCKISKWVKIGRKVKEVLIYANFY